MSKLVRYPLAGAYREATRILSRVYGDFCRLLSDRQPHSFADLQSFCETGHSGIQLVLDRSLPVLRRGKARRAFALKIADVPFIILDPELMVDGDFGILALAHELSHVALGHLDQRNPALANSETMIKWDGMLQSFYSAQIELEADLLAMMFLVPDGYLHDQVGEHIFIPVPRLSAQLGFRPEWLAARVQLYRKKFGYKISRGLLAERVTDRINTPDLDKWLTSAEGNGEKCLEMLLPHIDESFARMIGRAL